MSTTTRPLTLPIRVRDLLPGDVFLDRRDPAGQLRYEVNTLPAPDSSTGWWTFVATGRISHSSHVHALDPDQTLEVIQ